MFRKLKDILIISKPRRLRLALILATQDLPYYNRHKPLGLGYLKSYLHTELPEVGVDIYEDIDSLIQSRPDCVGVSASTQDFAVAQRYIKLVREELGCPVLLGGVHISFLPETLPKGAIACVGEGEKTLAELMGLFLRRYVFDPEELSTIKGIAFWGKKGNLVQTEPRELISPLDRLPLPDRGAMGIEPGGNDLLHMFTSRGCPYNCKFCTPRVYWKKYREFSSDYVLNEIEELVTRYGAHNVSFFDDLFIANRKRLREIADRFAKRRYNVGTYCQVRANLVDDELCGLLNKLNCREVSFGAESFSEPVLRELKSDSVTVAQNQHALDTLHKHGIKAGITMIFNAPVETREDMITSWRAIFNNLRLQKINWVAWGFLRPYPGSGYWDEAVKRGLCGIDTDWRLLDWRLFGSSSALHLNDYMTRAELDVTMDEWETKCYLVNLHFPEEATQPIHKYPSKEAIFVSREALIKSICKREPKDETDTFVLQEYERFLKRVVDNKIALSEGWWPTYGQSYRWIRKSAKFFIHSSVRREANLLNLIFFVPDIGNYPSKEVTVTFRIGESWNNLTIVSSGEHSITTAIPTRSSGDFFHCEIVCSNDFCPAKVGSSQDTRDLSIVVNRFEMACDKPSNIVNVMRLPEDGQE